jgi:flagellar protein FlgJ
VGAAGAVNPAAANPLPPPTTDARRGPQSSPGETTAHSASDFVAAVLPTIRAAAAALRVSPLGLLAQAALETGWGRRMARTPNGAPSLNLFGIKADEHWGGARATANTVEFSGGVATQKQTAFRAYGSIADSVRDFASLLARSPRYAEALAQGGNAQAYVQSIGQSGYATDPNYANKLNEILHGSTLRMALGLSTASQHAITEKRALADNPSVGQGHGVA